MILGDNKNNKIHAIKRVNFGTSLNVDLMFVAPEAGEHEVTLYLMCDSYVGCDQVNIATETHF